MTSSGCWWELWGKRGLITFFHVLSLAPCVRITTLSKILICKQQRAYSSYNVLGAQYSYEDSSFHISSLPISNVLFTHDDEMKQMILKKLYSYKFAG